MALYNQYYSSADCYVYLIRGGQQIYLDKLNGIMIEEESTSYPVYGLGDSKFGFITQGNYIVSGYIDLNMCHTSYMTFAIQEVMKNSAIEELIKPERNIENVSEGELHYMSLEEIKDLKLVRDYQANVVETSGMVTLPYGFNILVEFDNSNNIKNDGFASSIQIQDCKLIKSSIGTSVNDDSQVVRRYTFLGKEITEQTK